MLINQKTVFMTKGFYNCIIFFFFISMLTGCFADKKYSYPKEKEKEELNTDTRSNEFLMKKFARLPPVSIPTLQERLDRTKERVCLLR
jgi:hypothetical protein